MGALGLCEYSMGRYGRSFGQRRCIVHLGAKWAEMGALRLCGNSLDKNGRTEAMWVLFGQKWAQFLAREGAKFICVQSGQKWAH